MLAASLQSEYSVHAANPLLWVEGGYRRRRCGGNTTQEKI